jgi:hypothetical protein
MSRTKIKYKLRTSETLYTQYVKQAGNVTLFTVVNMLIALVSLSTPVGVELMRIQTNG